jgi:hypothetical protein
MLLSTLFSNDTFQRSTHNIKGKVSRLFKIASKIITFLNFSVYNSRSCNLLDETSIQIIVTEFKQKDLTIFKLSPMKMFKCVKSVSFNSRLGRYLLQQ